MNADPRTLADPWKQNHAIHVMIGARFAIANANTSVDGPLRPDPITARIRIAEFVRWARSLHWWLPEGLAVAFLADEGGDGASSWATKARRMADEIYRDERRKDCDPTKADIAKEIEKRNVLRSARGQLTWKNILRHGLKGWRPPR